MTFYRPQKRPNGAMPNVSTIFQPFLIFYKTQMLKHFIGTARGGWGGIHRSEVALSDFLVLKFFITHAWMGAVP